jgi:hypothetical protein
MTLDEARDEVMAAPLEEAIGVVTAFTYEAGKVIDSHPEGPSTVAPELMEFLKAVVESAEGLIPAR